MLTIAFLCGIHFQSFFSYFGGLFVFFIRAKQVNIIIVIFFGRRRRWLAC
jgi:hypothetical protein